MIPPKKILRLLLLCALAISATLFPRARAELLPEQAQEAIKQGLDQIQKNDYEQARSSFQKARKLDGSLDVYYEIGLAESKIPGRELRAICWFGAYLAANPKAANAAEVRKTIDALDAKSRDKTARLIQALQDAVQQIPEGEKRDDGLRDLADEWMKFGDYDAAKKAIDLIQNNGTKADALSNVANSYARLVDEQVKAGDMTDASKSLEKAQKATDLITNSSISAEAQYSNAMAWLGIAKGQLKAGDMKGVQESLGKALDLNERVGSPGSRNSIWQDIAAIQVAMAKAQFKTGDAAGAKESLAAALTTSSYFQPPFPDRLETLRDIAGAQIAAGDMTAARETLATAVTLAKDTPTFRNIARQQIQAGDLDGAKKTAGLMQDENAKAKMLAEVSSPPRDVPRGLSCRRCPPSV